MQPEKNFPERHWARIVLQCRDWGTWADINALTDLCFDGLSRDRHRMLMTDDHSDSVRILGRLAAMACHPC